MIWLVLVCAVGFVASVWGLLTFDVPRWVAVYRAGKQLVREAEQALVEDGVRTALIATARRVHYRYNIHCPGCGRFARHGDIMGVTDCARCGLRGRPAPETGSIPIVVVAVPTDELEVTRPRAEITALPQPDPVDA